MREAGDRTTWTAPDEAYEAAVHAAVDAAIDRPEVRAVVDEVLAAVAEAGWSNALVAKLVAITMPGVPDVYQGSELWEQSLVDPDNRRPVDFAVRRSLLDQVEDGLRPGLAGGVDDPGAAKLLVTRAGLLARREQPDLFDSYAPVEATGEAADHVLAFDRGGAVTVATRLPLGLAARGGWGDTTLTLPAGRVGRRRHRATLHRRRARRRRARRPAGGAPAAELRAARAGPRPLRRLGAAGRHGHAPDRTRDDATRVPMSRERTTTGGRPTGPVPTGRGRLRLPRRRRRPAAARPALAPPARRRARALAHLRRRPPTSGATTAWTGRQLAGSVIYELHVGTFTPEGTFDAALGKLDHLRSIGVDLVEVMPVNAFNGTHNWGYDGVLWSAVHEQYGGPAAYQRFVDGCHAAGIGVIQDVVHNHLGPSGNYLPVFGPYLKQGANTWGDLVNLDGEGSHEVRRLHPRQRADVVRRHARRRAAPRRRARALRRVAGPPARGDGDRGGRPVGPPAVGRSP